MNLSNFVSMTKFWFKKNSPEILVATGIISSAAAIVLACFETKKLDSITKPAKSKIEVIHSHLNDANAIANKQVVVEDEKKELTKVYLKTSGKVVLLYSPAVLSFAVGVGCILGSHNIMKGRNLALAAACSTLETSYKEYRERVKKELGEDAERKIYEDLEDGKKKITDENGKTKTVATQTPKIKANGFSILYAENQRGYEDNASLNYKHLMMEQAYLNDKLRTKGYLFLCDVYEDLGFDEDELGPERLKASHVIGWIYDPADKTRDSYVSFGLTDSRGVAKPNVQAQIAANEPNFWLNLNYDGDILTGDKNRRCFTETARAVK
jgi:hypothetical protein